MARMNANHTLNREQAALPGITGVSGYQYRMVRYHPPPLPPDAIIPPFATIMTKSANGV